MSFPDFGFWLAHPVSALGTLLVLGSLFFATIGCVAGYVAGARRNRTAWEWARNSAYGFSASMIGANLLMVYALVTDDFSVKYVAQVGSPATPTHISIISLWSSLEGSILFWGGVLGTYVGLTVYSLGEKHKEFTPWALHVLMGIAIFFAFLVGSIANPFSPIVPPPLDQLRGPNPLLQNHWLMAVHPPMLYLGYVGMSVPFSLICAALLAGRFEAGWMAPVRRWMMIPWTFLTFGIVLGGWWSYAVLGWGGAWAWDPVENASFLPWLTGTAFLHSAMVLQRRGKLRDWTLVLGMTTFLLTLLGTFMTRSGVFNSVHSFTQSSIGPVFLVFIGVVLTYSVVLLAFRSHLLDEEAKRTDAAIGARGTGGTAIVSREFAIVIQNLLFTVFTFTVLLGTLYPLIAEAFLDRRLSVGEPFFNKRALPLGLALVFMMGVGPALPWGRLDAAIALRRLAPSVVVGVGLAAFAGINGYTKPYTLLSLFVIGFALWANVYEFVEPVVQRVRSKGEPVQIAMARVFLRARRRFGGHIAHYGILLAVFALAMSKGYRAERDFTMAKGQAVEFSGFHVVYSGSERVLEPHRESVVAKFDVTRNERSIGTFGPRMNYYPTQREPIVTPAVHEKMTGDLYFSLIDVGAGDGSTVIVRLIYQPFQVWLWVCAPMIALGSVVALWPQRERRERAAAVPPSVDVVAGQAS